MQPNQNERSRIVNKPLIALKVAKSPLARKLVVSALKNPKVRGVVVNQAKKQVRRRLLGR